MTDLIAGLATDKRTLAWEALGAVLRASPFLSCVRTFRTWDGSPQDRDAPEVASCPWVRLTPGVSSVSLLTTTSSLIPFSVKVEVAVSGTNAANLINLWGAIENTFGRSAPSPDPAKDLSQYLRDVGGPNYGTYEPAINLTNIEPSLKGEMMLASGTILIKLLKSI